jgi:hypothetical protein
VARLAAVVRFRHPPCPRSPLVSAARRPLKLAKCIFRIQRVSDVVLERHYRVLPALVSFPASVGVPRYRSSLWQSRSSWCACDRGTREARELRIGSDSRGKDDEQGNFILDDVEPGEYQLRAEEPTFVSAISDVSVYGGQQKQVTLQLRQLVSVSQSITVVASATSLLTPDPAQSIVIHDQVLDANPGRPGAPISIPGYWKNGAENVITMVKWSSVSDSIT